MNRRQLLQGVAPALASSALLADQPSAARDSDAGGLLLRDFQPRSMLHTAVTDVPQARFPVIDFHTHLTSTHGMTAPDQIVFAGSQSDLLPIMNRRNVRIMVNLTGGCGSGLTEAISTLQKLDLNRFLSFTEPWWSKLEQSDYPQFQADQIKRAHNEGARGIKILKTLGLYLREHVTSGKLVSVDDVRFDPMWETAGALKMPIAIHTSDPEAFFLPIDRFNERYEELHAHPDWSFFGRDFPSNRELQEARRRVMKRHPKTQFVCLHFADSEDLPYVSECMDSHPNMHLDIAARIGELGRQPRAARKFIDRYQDRIVFGTDAVPNGLEVPQQLFCDDLYRIYYRFLETDDEYFDYAPAKIPPQGRWRISGLNLPEPILKKVYWENAARLLGLS